MDQAPQHGSMAYEDYGEGMPILFIHGHPFNRTMWHSQVSSVRWKYRAIVPDLHGYGESGRKGSEAYTQEMYAKDLAEFLDGLGVHQVCVVGLSMGGQIAMEFARAFPDRTLALVMAATSAKAETPEGRLNRARIAARIEREGIVPIGCETLLKVLGQRTLRNSPMLALRVFEMICATDPYGSASAIRGRALRRDYGESLRGFGKPSLIVVGTDDPYASVEEARELQSSMPDCRLEVFEDVGHMPDLEAEDRFNRSLHLFLESISLTSQMQSRNGQEMNA